MIPLSQNHLSQLAHWKGLASACPLPGMDTPIPPDALQHCQQALLHPLVALQVLLLAARLAALVSLARPFTGVDALVGAEGLLILEGLGAVGTGKGELPSVDALVAHQVILLDEPLATVAAGKGLLTSVHTLVVQ